MKMGHLKVELANFCDQILKSVKMNPKSRTRVGKEKLAKIEKLSVGAIQSGAMIKASVSTPIRMPKKFLSQN